jgi:glycosyltransferase involved in cell wall biosynthesis
MRIAHIITRMIVGGAQENTLLCCQDLMRIHGDDVLLITGPALGPEGDLLVARRVSEGDLCEAPSSGQGRGGEVPLAFVPELRRAIHPWRDLRSYQALKRILRTFQPDVVHTHSAKGGLLGRMAASAVGVKAIVHTVHGAPFHPYQSFAAREFFRRCEKFAADKCHKLVSVADAMTELMVGAGVAPREKFVTVYSGMEVEPFLDAHLARERVRGELGFNDEHVVVGKIARLFHLKGHEDVIRAAKLAVDRAPQVRFLFVGDGLLREDLERQIEAAGLGGRFRFTGLVPPARIPELLGAMDVLVHASFREGLARALPQALIAGKPVISYDIDGAREVVIPGETGFLLAPGSVEAMADAIVDLAGDETKRSAFGAAGRARFTDQFRHETMTQRLREIYRELLASRQ